MEKARANTSLIQVQNRHAFIFNGSINGMLYNNTNAIEYIDLGNLDQFSFKNAKWVSISVKEPEFISCEPRASAYLPISQEIIIFGGTKKQQSSFIIKVDHLGSSGAQIQSVKSMSSFVVQKQAGSDLLCDTKFCQDSDYLNKTFGNYLYALDCN